MDREYQTLFLKTVCKFVRDEIEKAVRPLVQRIAELETRGVEYKGTFQRSCFYARGDLVTHSGSLWCAAAETKPLEIPGVSPSWVLAVKSGQDARLPTRGGARSSSIVEKRT